MVKLNDNALQLLKNRYYLRNKETGELVEHTPEEMFRRVAKHVSNAEKTEKLKKYWEDEFFNLMNEQLFMPNSPTLINAGKNKCLSACSVIGEYPDSLEGIYEYLWYNAKLTKYGCGVGQSLSKIRPKGEIIKSSGGKSAGVVNWMHSIQTVATTTIQGDTARRAANMVGLRFNHPDILDFINAKQGNDDFSAMNISVTITDEEFIKAINRDGIWLEWNDKKYKKVNAGELLDKIIENAWVDGEPGIIWIDKINAGNPFGDNKRYKMEITNPCGEQPLQAFEFCNLGSINVEKLYSPEVNDIDWDLFDNIIKKSIRFLDNTIDVNEYVLPQFKKNVLGNRKIGLGITGFANLLIKLGIKYDSQECLDFIDRFFQFKKKYEEKHNKELALEKGNFPNWKDSIFAKTNTPRRNATISTQAPTGSVSTILGTESYGIEPLFMVGYLRRIVDGEMLEVNQLFEELLHKEMNNKELENKIISKCIEEGTTELDIVPQQIKNIFRCANDISPEWHVKILAQMQKYYDNAISKTVNLLEKATQEDVKQVYIQAFNLGCKGVTVYRNNSRKNQTIQIGDENKQYNNKLERGVLIQCSDDLIGKKRKLQTGCGSLHINAFFDPITGELMEVFFSKGSTGGCFAYMNALSRQISSGLRSGQVFETVIDQLNSIQPCPSYVRRNALYNDTSKGSSCPNAVGFALVDMQNEMFDDLGIDRYYGKINTKIKSNKKNKIIVNKCPNCGEELQTVEGCLSCVSCGWSRCN